MGRALRNVLIGLLASACAPAGEDPGGDVLFLPGEPVDLEQRPLARIEDPTIVANGADVVLVATGVFFEVEQICGALGCIQVVVERSEPLCVSLRPPFEATGCPETDLIDHSPVAEFPPSVDTFVGRAGHALTPSGAMRAGDVTYFGVNATGPLLEEHFIPGEIPEDSTFSLEIAAVQTDGAVRSLDLSPDGAPLGERLAGWDEEGAPGAGLILRDGSLIELDLNADILAGSTVGEAYFDNNGGRNVAFARLGEDVISVRATETDDFVLGLTPLSPPVKLFVEVLPANPGPVVPVRTFRAIRAMAPTSVDVQVCFNQRLDPADLDDIAFDIEPIPAAGPPALLPGEQCVFIPTEAQRLRTPLTITVSGGQSAQGDALVTSTVSAQSPERFLQSVNDRVLREDFGFANTLVPLSDGGVLLTQNLASFEVGPDLRTLRESGIESDLLVLSAPLDLRLLAPDDTGAWIPQTNGIVRYDADQRVVYEATEIVTAARVFPLEGDRAIATDLSAGALLLDGGAMTNLVPPPELVIPSFQTPIHGTEHVLWKERDLNRHVRADYDGVIIEELDIPTFNGRFDWAAEESDVLFVSSGFGLGTLAPGSLESISPGVLVSWSTSPEGGYDVFLNGVEPTFLLRGGEANRFDVEDPFTAGATLGQPRFVGGRAFVRSFRNTGGLRVGHRDHWNEALADAQADAP